MLRNYLITAIRNLWKQRTHAIINIAGLAVGMAVFILILSYVWFELSFDRFHGKADQIYRVVQSYTDGDVEYHDACTGNLLAQALKDELPEILYVTRLGTFQNVDLHYKDNQTLTMKWGEYLRVDPSVFDVFDITIISGNPKTALDEPNSIILTEELAVELFGEDDPMGRSITITQASFQEQAFKNPNKEFLVTGIAKAMPSNSHFDFNFLLPYGKDYEEWYYATGVCTYIVLPKGYPPASLEEKFPAIVRKYFGPEYEDTYGKSYDDWIKAGGQHQLHLQPLKDIYLDSYYTGEYLNIRKGNLKYIYLLSVIAFLILLLACTNYILITIARSLGRIKEVGIRKITGAGRYNLITQFLMESVLTCMLALVFSIILVYLFLPSFNSILDRQLSLVFSSSGFVLLNLVIFAIFVGILAGAYPAFTTSSFQPVTAIAGGRIGDKPKGISLKNSIIVFQFTISIVLIVASLVLYRQLSFIQRTDTGFDKNDIVVIRIGQSLLRSKNVHELDVRGYEYYREQRFLLPQTFKQELLKHPNVLFATVARPLPGSEEFNWWMECQPEGIQTKEKYHLRWIGADPDYIPTLGLELVAGHNYSSYMSPMAPDSPEGIILNETAVKYFGWKEPIGKYIIYKGSTVTYSEDGTANYTYLDTKAQVIGVVKDFHFKSFHSEIQPLGIWPGGLRYISVKIQPFDVQKTIEFLEKTWNTFAPEVPFKYSFLDDDLDRIYEKEKRLGRIFLYFTLLSTLIASLGLYGLASFTTEQRTKEIGIRKVLGASYKDIIKLLSKTYLLLVTISNIVAWPIGWLFMRRWLQDFAYRIDIGAGIFLLTGLIALIIVGIAVSFQAFRASFTDPVESLRYE